MKIQIFLQSSLSEADRAEMEEFIHNAKLLLNTLGHKFLEATELPSDSSSETDIFSFEGRDYSATGATTSDGFVVFKNSIISKKANSSLRQSIINKRNELITQKIIDDNYTFSSPSTAASIISGSSTNGQISWKNKQGTTLKDYESK